MILVLQKPLLLAVDNSSLKRDILVMFMMCYAHYIKNASPLAMKCHALSFHNARSSYHSDSLIFLCENVMDSLTVNPPY